MPIILKPGATKRGYTVVRELNRGAFANAYEATSSHGERVFFKQYKSPTRLTDWYTGFVNHQQELKSRIERDPAARERCYRFVEFFEETDFYQVFEFIDGGKDLAACVAKPSSFRWEQWAVFAKVMMFGIKGLHEIKVVHTDLKPENLILIPDDSVGIGYRLRIIDLDWAIFTDATAPWHGIQGYVGSPGYESPEHVQGKVPLPASDIFTCGIMLSQMLGHGHPFADSLNDHDRYIAAVKGGRFKPIRLREALPKVGDLAACEAILNACLDPHPRKRPSAAEVCEALIGKSTSGAAPVTPAAPKPKATAKPAAKPAAAPKHTAVSAPTGVALYAADALITRIHVDAVLGKHNFRQLTDSQFYSDPQCRIFKRDGRWWLEHDSSATNETLLNGKAVVKAVELSNGARLAVGNSARKIEKCPVEIRLEPSA